jgi:hypothetical protein
LEEEISPSTSEVEMIDGLENYSIEDNSKNPMNAVLNN